MAKVQIARLVRVSELPELSELSETQQAQIIGGADVVATQSVNLKDGKFSSGINFVFLGKDVSDATVIQLI